MTLRFFSCVLILAALTSCDSGPRTFTLTRDLQKEAINPGTLERIGAEGKATIDLSVKFDQTPHAGQKNVGVAYYRVDITNDSNHRLSIGAVYLQFHDEMEISIGNCKLESAHIKPYRNTAIQINPGELFSASSSCEFPISQMDQVEKITTSVDYNFIIRSKKDPCPSGQ